MAKQEECSKCKRAKQGGYAGEIKCSFYGRKPLFDDSPCPSFSNVNIKCPECGKEVPPSEKVCPNCGCPMKEDVAQSKNIQHEVSSNANNTTPQTPYKNGAGKVLLFVLVGIALVAGTVFVMKSFSQKEAKAALYDSTLNAEKERESALEAQQKAEEERRRADPYMEKGWNFLLTKLKTPSTASLVDYYSPNEEIMVNLAKDAGISSDEKVAAYEVDAQNGFGAMIRTTYFVYFRNGEPYFVTE